MNDYPLMLTKTELATLRDTMSALVDAAHGHLYRATVAWDDAEAKIAADAYNKALKALHAISHVSRLYRDTERHTREIDTLIVDANATMSRLCDVIEAKNKATAAPAEPAATPAAPADDAQTSLPLE